MSQSGRAGRVKPIDAFDLLETLRWDPVDGYVLLDRHLQRLRASSEYFDRPFSIDEIRGALARAVTGAVTPWRVRLLVDCHGEPRTEQAPLQPLPVPMTVGLAVEPIDPTDPFLRHKTTSRERYERHRSAAHAETILWNPARDVTEAITANIVVEIAGRRVTPALGCGLLPGTMRAELLDRGEIVEANVGIDELLRADRFWLINSVRGWLEAVLDPASTTGG